jgi:hypothetical protein
MRSFILTAAIAATLVSTSLTAGYAASSAKAGATATRAESAAATRAEKNARAAAVRQEEIASGSITRSEQADPVPPVVIYPQRSMSVAMIYPRTRLSLIESELGKATHDINVNRHRGELTRSQASFLRREDSSVRAEAMNVAREHRGRIPIADYAMLQDRVSDLNRTIHRDVVNTANG